MWSKVVLLFCCFTFTNSIFISTLFWTLDRFKDKIIFGIEFPSFHSFAGAATIVLAPIILVGNFLALTFYSWGYSWLGDGSRVWPVQMALWGTGPLAFVLVSYFWRHEVPHKGAIIGMFFYLIGAIISKVYK
ncbi:MAG: hypothetical protein ABII97_02925 [Patescibacteria group bacterium]